ncbi:hypothetical protein [Spirosoma pollinicola]|uniref:Uncharacterized protein n=1 Tax=Spirosoma pollinicola TaxID=2057025 RepID=A0A2K8Z7U3_9BACT|nr:hypothetical protein [Spirosoma pollinicola]AUD05941.1 hypothetical protein CWM47_31315 [Spirosoma pollinicola]
MHPWDLTVSERFNKDKFDKLECEPFENYIDLNYDEFIFFNIWEFMKIEFMDISESALINKMNYFANKYKNHTDKLLAKDINVLCTEISIIAELLNIGHKIKYIDKIKTVLNKLKNRLYKYKTLFDSNEIFNTISTQVELALFEERFYTYFSTTKSEIIPKTSSIKNFHIYCDNLFNEIGVKYTFEDSFD